jgi:hypothetical protein
MKGDVGRNIFRGAPLTGFSKQELIEALSRVQHFLPPRPTRQAKHTLIEAAKAGLGSARYGMQMADALRDVRRSSAGRKRGGLKWCAGG